jgi:phenylacetate-CoA ligase
MRQSQFWSLDRIREYQLDKLQRLLNHAYAHVPYYSRLFRELDAEPGDFKTLADFKSFPILTKELIRENFTALQSLVHSKESLFENATGGSTGEPLKFYQDDSFLQWAMAARLRGWYEFPGATIDTSMAVLWGAPLEVSQDYTAWQRWRDYLLHGTVYLNAFNMSRERQAVFLRWVMRFRPKLIRGYFSALVEFADYLEETGTKLPWVKGVILCAETVDPEAQRRIEKVYGARSYNTYGGRELSLIAMECAEQSGMHEVSENNLVEYERLEGEWDDELSDLVITNLNNFGMPFIRYKVGDLAVPSTRSACPCGRGQPLIHRIVGRTTEVFTFADGTRIAGEMFIHLMKDVGLKEYQFVQRTTSSVTLRIRREESADKRLVETINSTYRPFLPLSVTLEIEPVDRIEKTLTGKFRFVYSELPNSLG